MMSQPERAEAGEADMPSPIIAYELYPNVNAKLSGVRVREPWTTFVARLATPRTMPVEHDCLTDPDKLDAVKTGLPLWRFVSGGEDSPSRSKGRQTPITGVNALVLDCDGSGRDPHEVSFMLGSFAHCWYSTFRHGVNGEVRFRVIVPLVRPIAPERYEAWVKRVLAHLGEGFDESAREPTRGFFAPGVPAPFRDRYEWGSQEGELLDPAAWPPAANSSPVEGINGAPTARPGLVGNLDSAPPRRQASRAKVLAAMACAFADYHVTWFDMACALRRTGWDDAVDLFLRWSQTTRRGNYNEDYARATWATINDDGDKKITPGTVIYEARRNGFDNLVVEPKHPAAAYWRARHEGETEEDARDAAHLLNSALDGGPLSADALQNAIARIDAWRAEAATQDSDWIAQPLLKDQYVFDSEGAAVAHLNQRIAYHAGASVIIDRALTAHEGDPFVYVRVPDAKNMFANRSIIIANDEKTTVKLAFDVWMKSPCRREYRRVVFDASDAPLDPRTLNLWLGFGVEPKAGDYTLIRKHMREVICGGDSDQYGYLFWLLAWKVQHPHLPTEIALVLRTEAEGSGKDTLCRILHVIFGSHYREAANADHLFKWNAALLANAAVVSIGEMLWSGNHQHAGRFKELITARKIGTEGKYANPGSILNTVMYVISSNENWVIPAGRDARRFFVPDMSSARVGDTAYFDALYAEIDGGGPAALLHKLLAVKLSDWHPRNGVPQTKALKEQKLQSLDPVPKWWEDCLQAGEVSFTAVAHQFPQIVISASDWAAGPVVANKKEMRDAYLDWARQQRLATKKAMSETEFFKQLRSYAPGGTQRAPGTGLRTGAGTGARFSDHATCVAQFEAALTRK